MLKPLLGHHTIRNLLRGLPAFACLGMAMLGPVGAAAADTSGPAARGKPDVMSRVELRQCMDRQDALARRRSIIDAEQALSDSEASALAEEARLLSEQMRKVDSRSAEKLANLNRQLAGHNESVKHFNASLEALSSETAELNADTADMMATCTTRLFSKDDQEAILSERRSGTAAIPRTEDAAPHP